MENTIGDPAIFRFYALDPEGKKVGHFAPLAYLA